MTDDSHPSSGSPVCFHERQSKHWVLIGGVIAAVVAATAAAASHMQPGTIEQQRSFSLMLLSRCHLQRTLPYRATTMTMTTALCFLFSQACVCLLLWKTPENEQQEQERQFNSLVGVVAMPSPTISALYYHCHRMTRWIEVNLL